MSGQTRRGALLGGAAAALLIAGGVAYEWPRFAASKFKGPYGDLVAKLADPKQAAIVGVAACSQTLHGCAMIFANDTDEKIDQERSRLNSAPLPELLMHDLKNNQIVDAKGWVLPATLGMLCVMAAHTFQMA